MTSEFRIPDNFDQLAPAGGIRSAMNQDVEGATTKGGGCRSYSCVTPFTWSTAPISRPSSGQRSANVVIGEETILEGSEVLISWVRQAATHGGGSARMTTTSLAGMWANSASGRAFTAALAPSWPDWKRNSCSVHWRGRCLRLNAPANRARRYHNTLRGMAHLPVRITAAQPQGRVETSPSKVDAAAQQHSRDTRNA